MKQKLTEMKSMITYIYLFFMLSFFLLYYENYYFNITESKYRFFSVATLLLMILAVFLFLTAVFRHFLEIKRLPNMIFIKEKVKKFKDDFSITDIAMFLFLLCNLISACMSRYGMEAFTGSTGRYLGWFGLSLLCFSYYYISRYYRRKKSILYVFILFSSLVFFLALLNFFNFDPLGFSKGVSYAQLKTFLSTIGNMNFLASLICLSVPVTVVLYTCSYHKATWLFHIPLSLAFGTLFAANSDSGFLGLGMFGVAFLVYVSGNIKKLKRLLLVFLNFLCTAKILYLLYRIYETHCRGLESLSLAVSSSPLIYIAIIICLLLYLFLYKRESWLQMRWNTKIIRRTLLILFGAFGLIVCVAFYYFTVIDKEMVLGEWSYYLRFNDAWGNSRGLIWRMAAEDYQNYSLIQKLFGCGPDTIRSLITNTFGAQHNKWDNCHNEYLQYLMTGGLCTLISYLTVLISSFYRQWKNRYNSCQLAVLMALTAYAIQAVVNVNQPFTTPIFFLLLGIGEAYLRTAKVSAIITSHSYVKEVEKNDERE